MKTVANHSQSPTPKVIITRPTTDNSAKMLIAIPVTTVAITVFIGILIVVLYSLRSVSRCLFDNILVYWFLVVLLGRLSNTNQSQQEMKCGVVRNPAYDVVHVQGSAGVGLEPDYNMENNPLYEMRIKSNKRHSHQTEIAAGVGVYENVDNAALWGRGKLFPNSSTHVFKLESTCINNIYIVHICVLANTTLLIGSSNGSSHCEIIAFCAFFLLTTYAHNPKVEITVIENYSYVYTLCSLRLC